MSSFLHHNTASLVLTLIELQQGKFPIFKIQSHCICFMKIYNTDRFYANFGQNRVIQTRGKFPIQIFTILDKVSPGWLKHSSKTALRDLYVQKWLMSSFLHHNREILQHRIRKQKVFTFLLVGTRFLHTGCKRFPFPYPVFAESL